MYIYEKENKTERQRREGHKVPKMESKRGETESERENVFFEGAQTLGAEQW